MVLTSYMKMSKTRVATGSGKVVRKSVRNQEEAYMDVWKLWERKWVFRSGSCSWGGGRRPGAMRRVLGTAVGTTGSLHPEVLGLSACTSREPSLTCPGQHPALSLGGVAVPQSSE